MIAKNKLRCKCIGAYFLFRFLLFDLEAQDHQVHAGDNEVDAQQHADGEGKSHGMEQGIDTQDKAENSHILLLLLIK